jgi:hypothetical protein
MFLALVAERKDKPDHLLIIIDGDMNEIEMDAACLFLSSVKVTPCFISSESEINYSFWLTKYLDGVNWARSFAAFCKDGSQAKPVFEWDD